MRAVGVDIPHAVDAAERVLNVTGDVVGNILFIHAAVGGDEGEGQDIGVAGLAHRHPLVLHRLRQFTHRRLQLVLNLLHGFVRVGTGGEAEGDRRLASGAALGGHIHQVIEAGHILFDNLSDGILQGLRGGAGIVGGDPHVRRGEVGILFNGKRQNGKGARQT